jgi:hypothetical protein
VILQLEFSYVCIRTFAQNFEPTYALRQRRGHHGRGGELSGRFSVCTRPNVNVFFGKLFENANVSSAVLPAWRIAKGHVCSDVGPLRGLIHQSPDRRGYLME